MVEGRSPASPRITARSVPWPLPVKASEPCNVTVSRPVRGNEAPAAFARNRWAATIGPTVWEEDGPMPILKMSKTDRNMATSNQCSGLPA